VVRSKFGIEELDRLLGGGLIKGDAILLAGSAGSGKTTLGLQFIVNGIGSGEPGIYVTFEELPDQLYRDAANFGWDLRELERTGKLRVICTSPKLLLDPDVANAILGRVIREINAKRIVFDSLSHLAMFTDESSLRMQAYGLVMLLKRNRMTSMMIWEISQVIGASFSVTDLGLSFLLDGIILLRPVEIDASLRRAFVILKMRGTKHDRSLREYEITEAGFTAGSSLSEYSGILSGTPTKVAESVGKLREWLMKQPSRVDVERYPGLCDEILAIDGVRYCAVRNAAGSIAAGGQKSGIPSIESDEDRKNSEYRVSLMSGLFGASPESFGRPEMLSMRFKNLRLLSFPLGEGAVLFVTLSATAPAGTADKVVEVVSRYAG